MIPEIRVPTHPGVILGQQFLGPLGMSQVAFAAHLGVSVQRHQRTHSGQAWCHT
jgi:plasmid maintenance system antidote protein VapI